MLPCLRENAQKINGGKKQKVRFRPGFEPRTSFFPAKKQINGRPVSRTVPEPYISFILTVLYGFEPYRTVTVPDIRSENGDTAYKHSPGYNMF